MHIWLIDDDEIEHILVEGLLRRLASNSSLQYFAEAESALDALESQKLQPVPDLILLDLSMPGMDGFEFLVRFDELKLAEKFPQTSIYILSSSASHRDREKSLAFGFVKGYLLKPLLMTQLQALMQELEAPLEV